MSKPLSVSSLLQTLISSLMSKEGLHPLHHYLYQDTRIDAAGHELEAACVKLDWRFQCER